MTEIKLNEEKIRIKIREYCDSSTYCGLEAFVVKKDSPKLRRIVFSEEVNSQGKNLRTMLKEMFLEILEENFLAHECEYADGHTLADNQHKYLIFEQGDNFQPFSYLCDSNEIHKFENDDLQDSTGLIFCLRKGKEEIWLYQHLWSIMVPNKKKTSLMSRLMRFENQIVFAEQCESLLTIARKIDIIIMDNHLITNNISLLQKYFGFQDYIYQSAQRTIQCIVQKNIIENTEKLNDYIGRGKSKYAKKMMRIGSSKVLDLTQEQLMNKVNTLPRWKGKFSFNQDTHQIVLNTYKEVESLIDLFDERYTRSDVTDTEYDTDVKTVAQPRE